MLAQYLDLTEQYNAQNGFVNIDVSNYDYCLIQPIGQALDMGSTIDGGAITGVTDGSAVSAINFTTVQGTLISTGGPVTSAPNGGITKLNVVGRFINLEGATPITKLLIMLAKIS